MNRNYTKQSIWEAFYELSAAVPFDKLTVETICRTAGVSKATFYRHFMDKYDVLNYNSLAIVQRLVDWEQCRSWKEFLLKMFLEIQRERDYYFRAFKTSGQNAHSRFLFEYSFGIVRKCYLTSYGKDELSRSERYTIAHYCHGCVDTLEDWLREPEAMSAEEMAELFYTAMPLCLRDTWLFPQK